MTPISYFQGDLLQGTFSLRSNDACTPGKQNPYVIPSGAVVKMLFPGISPAPSVSIDSATAVASEFGGGFEVTVTSASDGDCSFTLIPTKGALVALSAIVKAIAQAQPIDIIVSDSSGSQLQTFEVQAAIVVSARANP